jgi:hypothetical protein
MKVLVFEPSDGIWIEPRWKCGVCTSNDDDHCVLGNTKGRISLGKEQCEDFAPDPKVCRIKKDTIPVIE